MVARKLKTLQRHREVPFASYRALGMRVDCVQIPEALAIAEGWIAENSSCRYITFSGMHGAVDRRSSDDLKKAYEAASLNVADGMPLVWLARTQGIDMKRRCYGPEFLEEFCKISGAKYRHFFYGSTHDVLDKLTCNLKEKYNIQIAGFFSPPFRSIDDKEQRQIVKQINSTNPDVVWVGLGCPKQEIWIYKNRAKLSAPLAAAVGAAFDFHAGMKPQAPVWMRENGMEWFFRLVTEPTRLCKRYLVNGSKFIFLIASEIIFTTKT